MPVFTDPRYRIKRSAAQEEQMKYLIQELKIFQSYPQLLMMSAIVGYNNKAFAEIQRFSEPVQVTFFSEKDKDFMDFIAYAHAKDQHILSTNEKYTIFENYANGGFPILAEKLGVNFDEPNKNDRLVILKSLYTLLLTNGFSE